LVVSVAVVVASTVVLVVLLRPPGPQARALVAQVQVVVFRVGVPVVRALRLVTTLHDQRVGQLASRQAAVAKNQKHAIALALLSAVSVPALPALVGVPISVALVRRAVRGGARTRARVAKVEIMVLWVRLSVVSASMIVSVFHEAGVSSQLAAFCFFAGCALHSAP